MAQSSRSVSNADIVALARPGNDRIRATHRLMTATSTHIVLTRFNVRSSITGRTATTSPDWLLPRLELFETFCLPSMLAQTAPYHWLVFFDAETPPEIRERVNAFEAVSPVWVDGTLDDERMALLVSEQLQPSITHLITTRLDNDDCIADNFLHRVQRTFVGQDAEYVNFPLGYQWQQGRLYYSLQRSNPFLSYIERVRPSGENRRITTVYTGNHDSPLPHARVRQLWGPPMWVQVLHSRNVANEMQGIRRFRSTPPGQFSELSLFQDRWLARQIDLARSVGHLAVQAWLKRRKLVARVRRPRPR